jgi:hypothetical protein
VFPANGRKAAPDNGSQTPRNVRADEGVCRFGIHSELEKTMLPAAHLPFPPPDWYREQEFDPFKGKRVPHGWPWLEEQPLRVETPTERPARTSRRH